MDGEPTAMLFCPPLPPLRLPTDRAVVIGRQPGCEFPLRRGNVSRRHAEVRFDGQRFLLQDLGSTNGTYLNGEAVVGARPLSPGDRIEVSACTVTFCEIGAGIDGFASSPGEEKTLLFARPVGEAFRGELLQVPPFAVLQMLEMGSKSGMLEIDGDDESGRIWFVDGAPVHAETEKANGFEAALALVAATRGQFRFDPLAGGTEKSIDASVTELLLEASRRLDEAAS